LEFSESPELVACEHGIREPSIRNGLYRSSRWLKECDLREKEVTVVCDSAIIERFRVVQDTRYWGLFCLDVIRCRKFHLPGVDGALVTNLTQVIEGKLSIPALEAAFRETIQHFERFLGADGSCHDFRGGDQRLLRNLKEAARMYNTVKFEKVRVLIMDRCDVLLEELKRRHEELKAAASRPLFN
jgi:hypothetical protein